ncbi:MAG: hypothetical protein IJ609_01360 [Paludibacteraceae bacterium]|nr:hypothetical protein [Paludibacteraceae bacterium]
MKYFFTYDVRHQDVDHTRQMRLHTLENYLLEVAGTVADQLGFGICVLGQQNLTWILTSLALEMQRMPRQNERITFETWIESNAHMLSVRDFRIWREDTPTSADAPADATRTLLGICRSVWAVLELDKREIVNIFDQPIFDGCIDGEVLPMARAPRIRPADFDRPDALLFHDRVCYSDLDYNRHCNSCNYLRKMLDAHLPAFLNQPLASSQSPKAPDSAQTPRLNRPFRLDISYLHEVLLNDPLDILVLPSPDDTAVSYLIRNAANQSSSLARLACL